MATRDEQGLAPRVVLGVTGSIAAFKAVELLRLMQKKGWDVSVVMTDAATRFVTPLTFQTLSRNTVGQGLFDETDGWHPEHIAYADRADVLLIAPCTANVIAKIAYGLADDLLTCTVLATKAPLVIAPAMNDNMWAHPATRANVVTLQARGVAFVEVASGDLACGREGQGRLADLQNILTVVESVLTKSLLKRGVST
ncbi:MAG: flavoprotein [bacterium]|jgi:phosphopantothenoylcysteine decarboxylase/phosphopantothenate--cysteine ligase